MRSAPAGDPDSTPEPHRAASFRPYRDLPRRWLPDMLCRPSQIRSPKTRHGRGGAAWSAVGIAVLGLAGIARGQGFAGAAFAPEDAVASIRATNGDVHDGWIELAIDAIEVAQAPIRSGWESCEQLRTRLAPECTESFHAVGPGGRHWIHAIRWSDPIAVEFGLQRAGSRPMGAGRFRLPALGLEIALAGRWLLISPSGCPWLDRAVDLATLDAVSVDPDAIRTLVADLPRSPIEVVLRHAAPVDGLSAIGIQPTSASHAVLELGGNYGVSPLPIRTAAEVDVDLIGRFDGRVAFATLESGIGLLDPRMIEHAARHPELVPDANLRGLFAAQRLVVFDGEPVRIDPIGIVEVPAACVAVPVRSDRLDSMPVPTLTAQVDAWIESAGRSIRATWNDDTAGPARTRGDEIRHFAFGPGLLEASGGHPVAIGASLNWTVHASTDGGRWLIAGTSPSLVRRVASTLDEPAAGNHRRSMAGMGVASPARIALQLAELASLRRLSDDADAMPDAEALAATAALLCRVERLGWTTSRQDDHVVRASAEIRLMRGATRTDGSSPR
jgi:hypothetical protein